MCPAGGAGVLLERLDVRSGRERPLDRTANDHGSHVSWCGHLQRRERGIKLIEERVGQQVHRRVVELELRDRAHSEVEEAHRAIPMAPAA